MKFSEKSLPPEKMAESLMHTQKLSKKYSFGLKNRLKFIADVLKNAPPPGAGDYLLITKPNTPNVSFELKPPKAVVGRSSEVEISLPDIKISREHCQFEKVGDNWFLKDLGSKNGISINGEKTREHMLISGDLIQVGTYDLIFLKS